MKTERVKGECSGSIVCFKSWMKAKTVKEESVAFKIIYIFFCVTKKARVHTFSESFFFFFGFVFKRTPSGKAT